MRRARAGANTAQYGTVGMARQQYNLRGGRNAPMWSTQALLRSTPEPATDYAAAEAKFAALHALDGKDIRGVCSSTLLTHGMRTPRAYVLLHGLSNCPRQYVEFAPLLHARGANVLIPRMPRHGGVDLSGRELAV